MSILMICVIALAAVVLGEGICLCFQQKVIWTLREKLLDKEDLKPIFWEEGDWSYANDES